VGNQRGGEEREGQWVRGEGFENEGRREEMDRGEEGTDTMIRKKRRGRGL
jgi:hypothetical protein